MKNSTTLLLAAATLINSGCGDDSRPKGTVGDASVDSGNGGADGGIDAGVRPVGERPDLLSEWSLFKDPSNQVPEDDVVPYDLISPLFTDYAVKHRFLVVPEGEKIGYTNEGAWDFPVGSILVKTFGYPIDERNPSLGENLLETRLLVHQTDGWAVFTYVYNEDQTDGARVTGGRTIPTSWIDNTGTTQSIDYAVPTNGACRKCHGTAERTRILAPQTGQLNRNNDYGAGLINQIDHIASLGLFDTTPPAEPSRLRFTGPDDLSATATDRARGYLDANCGHCHSPEGETSEKNLFLDFASTDPITGNPGEWGVCKSPTSAGNADCAEVVDIVPGSPDDSLMVCRMEINTGGLMPPIGRSVVHTEGIEIVSTWIADMEIPGASCVE